MAATTKAVITDEIKSFIELNLDKKPKVIAHELGVDVKQVRWYLWWCRNNLNFDFDVCPITGFKNCKKDYYAL